MNVKTVHIVLPAFDLSYVQKQVAEKHPDMTAERVAECVAKYRNYLAICKAYPQVPIMPSEDIDLVWHQHILNTVRYMVDCQEFLGRYLHHNPKMPTFEVAKYSVNLYARHFGGGEPADMVMCGCSDMPAAMPLVMCGCSDMPVVEMPMGSTMFGQESAGLHTR